MTQASHAQQTHRELASKSARKPLTLAQRRSLFADRMRHMALSDLQQVSVRLKGLASELDETTAKRWKQYERAQAMKIPPRTFQSWENGEVENSDGTGYDKMARFYSRKLGRKITRNWIVFGDDKAPADTPKETPDLFAYEGEGENGTISDNERLAIVLKRLAIIESKLDAELAIQKKFRRELLTRLDATESKPARRANRK